MSENDPTPGDDATGDATGDAASNDDLRTTTRRNAAKWMLGISGGVSVVGVVVNSLTGIPRSVTTGSGGGANGGGLYVKGTHLVDSNGNRLTADALKAGSGNETTVFPEKQGGGAVQTKDATTLLLRFTESDYQSPTKVNETAQGYVAYSAVCTHEGCIVSDRKGENLFCPCHQSVYNPTAGAKVVGGPAPRALPQLPIGVTSDSNHLIIATGGFEGPIGPQ